MAATVRAAADLWWQHRVAMVARVELGGSVPEVYEQSMRNIELVRTPTVELLRRHGQVPEAADADEAVAPGHRADLDERTQLLRPGAP